MVAAELGIPGAATATYVLTNPSASTATAGGLGASCEDPIHEYDATEFAAGKRLSHNFTVQAPYRYSRLYSTFEGFFRDDNGQSDHRPAKPAESGAAADTAPIRFAIRYEF